jgi:release factor glutamine methyltransferase
MSPPEAAAASSATLATALRTALLSLRRAGVDAPAVDARRLLVAALKCTSLDLLTYPERVLSPAEAERYALAIARRCAREPVSRITGAREFFGRAFALSPATLDPRPASETLITAALDLLRQEGAQPPRRVLDVGTGSGCLLITLLCELPEAIGLGTDKSPAALHTARSNAHRLGVAGRALWAVADGLAGVVGPFDLVVSNPPYIPTATIAGLEPEVRQYDPRLALDGGPDGLCVYRRLFTSLPAMLGEGWVLLEVGHDQAEPVAALLEGVLGDRLTRLELIRDCTGTRRCVAGKTRRHQRA